MSCHYNKHRSNYRFEAIMSMISLCLATQMTNKWGAALSFLMGILWFGIPDGYPLVRLVDPLRDHVQT